MMMSYKNIDDKLTTREFNGIVSLLRDNVLFNEDIQINTSNVKGAYGEYQFNFREATMLDNGVLITNQTLTTIGTVKLVNPAFPHSNYYLDLKVYSSEDIGVLDEEDVLVTPLTVKLVKDTEVNIPFETLEMNNIIGFDATVRIDHKDLVIKGLDKIILETNKSKYGYKEEIQLTALYTDDNGSPIEGKEVVFKVNDRYLDTVTTNSEGMANLTCVYENKGNYIFNAQCNNIISNICETEVIVETLQANFVNENRFNLQGNRLITFTGVLKVDWGDGTIEEFTSFDNMVHTYSSVGNYSVKYTGYITEFRYIFDEKELSSVSIPNTVTKINNNAFYKTKINSITLPSSVIELGYSAFSLSLLTDITLSENLKIIGESAFANCTSLNSIDIPKSVINMDNRCFYKSVKHMYLNWETSDEILQYNSHWDDYGQIEKFHIPAQTKSLYIAKGYPASKLFEPISYDGITLTSDRDILSYNGGTNPDVATLTAQLTSGGEPVAVSGETVTFEVRKQSDDSLVETLSDVTDSSGVATVSYTSKGAGDLYIKAGCTLVSKIYEVHDYWGYKASGSATFNSSSTGFIPIYDLNDIGDCEITATLNSSVNKGFTLTYKVGNDTTTTNRVSVGADGSGHLFSQITENGSSTQHNDSGLYSANQDVSLLIRLENGNVLVKCNSNTFQSETHSNLTPRYVGVMSWNSAKTVQYSDLIVKKL